MSIQNKDVINHSLSLLEMHYNGLIDLSKISPNYSSDDLVKSLMMVCFCYKEMQSNSIGEGRIFPFLEIEIDKEKDFTVARMVVEQFVGFSSGNNLTS
jgi:hypothetical protein